MKKTGIEKDVILLLVTTLITVAVWVGVDVYRAFTFHAIPTDIAQLLTPINPSLQTSVLDNLEQKTL